MTARTVEQDVRALGYPDMAAAVTELVRRLGEAQHVKEEEPAVVDVRPDWQSEAACLGKPAEWFFPKRGEETRRAKGVCLECPVRQACLEYALVHEHGPGSYRGGVWGGLDWDQRDRLLKQRRRNRVAS